MPGTVEPRRSGVVARARSSLLSPGSADVGLTLAATLAGSLAALLALEVAGDYVNFRRDRVLIVLVGLGVAVLALTPRRVPWGAAALSAAWIVGWLAITTIPDEVFIETPVVAATGGAAYYGTPYLPQQVAAAVIEAAVLAAAVGYVLVTRLWGKGSRVAASATPYEPTGRWRPFAGALVAGVGVAVIALSVFPDLPHLATSDPLAVFKGNLPLGTWDLSNLLTWNWLIEDGAVPMRDFFWPYGQTWVFSVFPLGPLWSWLANSALLSFASWALWRLSPAGGREVRVLLCALAFVMLATWQSGVWRYSVPLVLALVYAAESPAVHRRLTWGHAVLALAALNAALWGTDLLVYGLGGMALVLLGELLSGRVALRPLGPLVRGLAVDAAAMLAVLLVPLLWILQGSFEANARFSLGLRGVSAASAPALNQVGALHQFIQFTPTYEMVSVMAPAMLLAAGLVHTVLGGPRVTPSRLLLAAGGASFMLLLKHLVRPQGEIMFLIPILALVWCAILCWQVRRWVLAAAVGALVATFVWTIEQANVVGNYWTAAKDVPRRVIDSVELTGATDRIAVADRRQFQRANLPKWPLELSMSQQLQREMARQSDDSFAVLGDAPYVYIYFKERPPFHVELYDASKRDEQQAMVDELEEANPNLILWRWNFAQDSVPQAVRNPIVLKWIIGRYVPVRKSQNGDVLRRRREGERADPDYWRARLGDPLSLGYMPAASAGEDADGCEGGPDCHAYAVLEGKPPQRDQQLALTVSGRGQRFGLILLGRPRDTEYAVRLDRLWFAPLVGPSPEVASGPPGFSARLERHRTGEDLW